MRPGEMTMDDDKVLVVNEGVDVNGEAASEQTPGDEPDRQSMSDADIRHNMKVLILLDSIFFTGAADSALVMTPLYVFLKASDTQIGLIGSFAWLALIGYFVSPFISVRFPYKRFYLLVAHIPYIGVYGALGLALLLSRHLGLSNEWLFGFLFAMMVANMFFGGFVGLPHQEYLAACIPMSHRGRFTGFSWSIGAVGGVLASAVGYVILRRVDQPMSFGYLLLMSWVIMQTGYLMVLFGRERPTPVEKAPKPWTKGMLAAAWKDKLFLRIIVLNVICNGLFIPAFFTFVPVYGYRALGMIPAAAATISIVLQVVRVGASSPIGLLTDRIGPKRVLPIWWAVGCLAFAIVVVVRHPLAIYISAALSGLFQIGTTSSFTALITGVPSPENRSGHFTLLLLAATAGASLGMLLLGAMCHLLDYRVTFAILGVVCLAFYPITVRLLAPLSTDAADYA